jgi:hypothetical protein
MTKVSGAKAVKNKSLKSETLPSRMARASITPGDQFARATGRYGKNSGPSSPAGMAFMRMGRFF